MLKTVAASIAALTFATGFFVGPANAVSFDRDFVITASDFLASAPVKAVTFSFDVELDPTINSGTTTNGLTVNSFNLADSVEYNYSASSTNPPKVLTIGSDVGVAFYDDNPNEFGVFIENAFTGDPRATMFSYTDAESDTYVAENLTIKYTDEPITPVPAAPEPAAWILMFLGVATLGGFFRITRRNKWAATAIA